MIFVAFIITVAIAVGVGVGIWHRQFSSHLISEDTSLAAVIFANDDRQLFYQDNTGPFRRVSRTPSGNQWYTSSVLDSNCNPKSLTPLAVTVIEVSNGFPPQVPIKNHPIHEPLLANVHVDHTVLCLGDDLLSQCSSKNSADGIVWYTTPTNYSTAVGTRSLSVTTINVLSANSSATANTTASGSDTKSTTVYLLFYENPTGEASALLQRVPSTDSPKATQWVDITSTLHELNRTPNSTLPLRVEQTLMRIR